MTSPNVHVFEDPNFDAEVLHSDLPVLVHFTAIWCGPCQALKPTVEKVADDFLGKVKVGTLDIDAAPQIARKYGIRSVPALLVFMGGRNVAERLGLVPREAILEMLGLS